MEAFLSIFRLTEPKQRAEAWTTAVEKVEGNQPTGAEVSEVVFEILHPEGEPEKPVFRARRRMAVVERLRKVIARKESWNRVEELFSELEELL